MQSTYNYIYFSMINANINAINMCMYTTLLRNIMVYFYNIYYKVEQQIFEEKKCIDSIVFHNQI